MSGLPQRTNKYTAEPVSDRYRHCLFDWLAAHAQLWNQLTYRRRQEYFTDDGNVWEADFNDLYDDYAPILGKATCQQGRPEEQRRLAVVLPTPREIPQRW